MPRLLTLKLHFGMGIIGEMRLLWPDDEAEPHHLDIALGLDSIEITDSEEVTDEVAAELYEELANG